MLLENLMIGSFCCGVGIRIVRHIRRKTFADWCERFTLLTLGVGFIIGMIGKWCGENRLTTALYCISAYITYVTLLFSWPPKISMQNEEVDNRD